MDRDDFHKMFRGFFGFNRPPLGGRPGHYDDDGEGEGEPFRDGARPNPNFQVFTDPLGKEQPNPVYNETVFELGTYFSL